MTNYTISGSPHVHGKDNTRRIMIDVLIALLPALLVAIYHFGLNALWLTLVSVATCILTEWLIQRFLMKKPSTIGDFSAVVTGVLLAFNVPSNLPIWMIIIGSIVAIGVAKMSFGGLGKNPFNPALVGRVFMLVSFPTAMTTWPDAKPITLGGKVVADACTGPTPLGLLKEQGSNIFTDPLTGKVTDYTDIFNLLLGNHGGSFGEVCAIALLIGAIYLLCRRVIDIFTPLSIMLTVFIFTGICHLVNPEQYIAPVYHLVYGGLILGAFYMATDMVTSPMTIRGKLLFGFGIGAITVIIRLWGAYPEGVSFAILIMNAFTPLINKAFKPKRFGVVNPNVEPSKK